MEKTNPQNNVPARLLLHSLATKEEILSEEELQAIRGAATTCSGGCADDCGRMR